MDRKGISFNYFLGIVLFIFFLLIIIVLLEGTLIPSMQSIAEKVAFVG